MSERWEFCVLAEGGGVPFAELCRRFGISRPTGYLWLERWRADGVAGLVDRSRRPGSSPHRTSAAMEELVVSVRQAFPTWGGRKLRRVLVNQGYQGVPAPSTITRILRRRGLIEGDPEPRSYVSFERAAPNQLWQMDFKGWFRLQGEDHCHPFGVLDDHSRFNLCLEACPDQRTGTVKARLAATFDRYGLPEAMLMDNGSPWGNDRGQPWTPLTVWLLDLGITVSHSRPFHPQTCGKQERFHQTLGLEVISSRPTWTDLSEVQTAFDTWRTIYNHQRPHDALDLQVPADRYQPSPRSMPPLLPEISYPDSYQIRKVSNDGNGRISFQGHSIRVGRAFTAKPVGLVLAATPATWHIYYRHQPIKTIDLDKV